MTDSSPLDSAFDQLVAALREHHDLARRDAEMACSEAETEKVRRAASRYAEELAGEGWEAVFGQLFPEGYSQDFSEEWDEDPSKEDVERLPAARREAGARWSLRGRWDVVCSDQSDLTLDSSAREALSQLAIQLFPDRTGVARSGEQWTFVPVDSTLADLDGSLIQRSLFLDP